MRASTLRLTLTLIFISSFAAAQQLEPRAYSPSPVGTTFLVFSFGTSSGGEFFDPTIPIENAKATLYLPALGVGQTFGLFGRQALVTVLMPYVWGTASGNVGEPQPSITRSGLGDMRVRSSINLHGCPAQTPKAFAAVPHRNLIVAASLDVVVPSGQYDRARLINIGSNRWAFQPEIGFSYPVRKFYFDLYASTWFFADNPNFFPGQATRSQSPLSAIQADVSYTIRPRMWVAFDATWYTGAQLARTADHPGRGCPTAGWEGPYRYQ